MSTTLATRPASVVALVIASVLWGTTGTAASFLPDSVSPVAVGACTMTVGGLLLFAVFARSSVASLRSGASRRWLILGAVGVVAYPLAFYSSMSLAGVAVGNVVSLGTGPVFAAVLERLIERRRLSPLWVVCTSVAVLGVVLLALSGGADATSSIADSVLGIGLGVVAGFSYALYTYASSRAIGAGSSAQGAMGAMFGMGAVGLLPVLLAVGAPLVQSPATIAIAAYLALLPMFVAYVLFGIGMRNLRSTTATTITLLEPVVATILAVVVVGERLAPLGWIGLIVIVAGVTVLATARQPRQTLQSP